LVTVTVKVTASDSVAVKAVVISKKQTRAFMGFMSEGESAGVEGKSPLWDTVTPIRQKVGWVDGFASVPVGSQVTFHATVVRS
jgi:hypothetical protein